MEPIDLILKIWGIDQEYKAEVEDILKNTSPKHIGLSLAYTSASSVDEKQEHDAWMEQYLPELQFV